MLLAPNHYNFPSFVGFLTQDPLLVWNTDKWVIHFNVPYLVIHCVLKQVKVFKDFEYHASIKRSHSLLGFLVCLPGNIAAGYFSDQSACNLNQCCIMAFVQALPGVGSGEGVKTFFCMDTRIKNTTFRGNVWEQQMSI